jgi:hypothetical protein
VTSGQHCSTLNPISKSPYACGNIDPISMHLIPVSVWNPTSFVKCSYCYAVSQHLILDPLVSPLCKCTNLSIRYTMICAVWPQLTRRSRGWELGQEGMCNRVRYRYEDEVAHTLAHASRSSWCGLQLCKRHERSNMRYKRKLIKNTYSTTAYAGLTAMRDLPRFIVFHSDVIWPYYIILKVDCIHMSKREKVR